MTKWKYGTGVSILMIVLLLSAGCSTKEVESLTEDRNELEARIEVLTEENEKLTQQLQTAIKSEKTPTLTLQHIEKQENNRFVPNETPILITPVEGSQELNVINANTVVEIVDVVIVNEVVWLYVTIPVFDSPINVRGWILEENTELYTEQNRHLVKSPVEVKAGTSIFKVDLFDQINAVEETKTENDLRCFISDQQEEHMALGCGGGLSFIISRENVIFPSIDN